jgi:creatinine amidohydrolase
MRWAEMTAAEVTAAAAAGSIALMPIGATEQHGPHIATGLDLRAAEAVVDRAAAREDVAAVIVPGLPFGTSAHWLPLGGTLSLQARTLLAVLDDVLASIATAGFTNAIVVNGHAGNIGPMLAAASSLRATTLSVEVISYWHLLPADELAARCAVDDGGVGHAGEFETSIAEHLGEPLVRSDVPRPAGSPLGSGPGSRHAVFARTPRPLGEAPGGVYGDPRPATAALGEFALDRAAAVLAQHCRELARHRDGD